MIDPEKREDRQLLSEAIRFNRQELEIFRTANVEFVKQYAGGRYGQMASEKKVPINLLEMAATIYMTQLASSNPSVLITSFHDTLRESAFDLQLALDHLFGEINLGTTISDAVLNAFFSIGIVKCGMTEGKEIEIDGVFHDVGQPFADVIDIDDWVHDTSAHTFEKVQFCGDRLRLPLDYVQKSGLYNKEAAKEVQPTYRKRVNESGDERISNIATGSYWDADEFIPHVELWEIWLPRENLVVTLPTDDNANLDLPPLRIVDWQGPERGPYHLLGFGKVPKSIMPLSPADNLADLHDLENQLMRKLQNQATRQKTITMYREAADAQRVKESADGEMIRSDDPQSLQQVKFGGIAQENLAFMIHVDDRFDRQAGNLTSIGGLGPTSDTIGQDAQIRQQSQARLSKMRQLTNDFTRGIQEHLAWYLWHDEFIEIPIVKRTKSGLIVESKMFTPEEREGDFLDYNIKLNPHSMTFRTPQERVEIIQSLLTQILLPALPMLNEQNITVNFENVFKTFSEYLDLPELQDILVFMDEQRERPGPVGSDTRGRQSPHTVRETVRTNRPGGTRQGNDQVTMNNLLGSRLQDSQEEGVLRGVG